MRDAPVVGGVNVSKGNGEIIRLRRGASIADFAVKKFFFDLLKVDTVAATGSLTAPCSSISASHIATMSSRLSSADV